VEETITNDKKNLVTDVDEFIALRARAGEQGLVADDTVRIATLKYISTPSQLLITLETGEVTRMPAATHCLCIVFAENQLVNTQNKILLISVLNTITSVFRMV
jgi:hypothetical protein